MAAKRKLVNETPQIVAAYKNNVTIRELSTIYGVSSGTIRNILKRENTAMRPRGRRKKVTSPVAAEEITNERV